MAEFYSWPQAPLLLLSAIFVLCALSQTVAAVMSFYRRAHGRGWLAECLLELAVLAQVFACSLLHGQAINFYELFIPPTGYGSARVAVFAMVVLLAVIVTLQTRQPSPLLNVLVAGLTLPISETAAGFAFAYLFVFAVIFWVARSFCVCRIRYREIRENPSVLSVKSAMDSLRTGIMFFEDDGFIVLSNTQMQRLMVAITGEIRRNGRHFHKLLMDGEIEPGCRTTMFEGHNVCLLPDGSVWMFTTGEISVKGKKYTQVTATNISERWKLTAELQAQNEELAQRQRELDEEIANLHILSHERETQRARMRAHSVLGERLALLLHAIRGEQALSHDFLRSMSQGLLDEIKAAQDAPCPQDSLDSLKQEFETIGVEILATGELPVDDETAGLFVDIIREATTNAVRHGFATQVEILMDVSESGSKLAITDNGKTPKDDIRDGSGIQEMREKIKHIGGTLTIAAHPRFVIAVEIPGGQKDV